MDEAINRDGPGEESSDDNADPDAHGRDEPSESGAEAEENDHSNSQRMNRDNDEKIAELQARIDALQHASKLRARAQQPRQDDEEMGEEGGSSGGEDEEMGEVDSGSEGDEESSENGDSESADNESSESESADNESSDSDSTDKLVARIEALEKYARNLHAQSRRPGKKMKDFEACTFKRHIREHLAELMDRKDDTFPAPPSEKQLQWFALSSTDGPTEKHWQYAYDRRPNDKWNEAAYRIFVTTFCRDYHIKDKKAVGAAFKTHMRYIQRLYNEDQEKLSPEVKAYRTTRNNRRGRRQTLLYHRLRGAHRFEALAPLVKVVEQLGVNGMSEDETDGEENKCTGGRTYRVTTPKWRSKSPEFMAFLKTLDLLYTSTKYRTGNYKAVQGNWTRMRLDGGMKEPKFEVDIPLGLPSNFYDSAWLKSLSKWDREAIEVRKPVKLDIPQKIISYASQFVRCYSREDKPTTMEINTQPTVQGSSRDPGQAVAKKATASREEKSAKSRDKQHTAKENEGHTRKPVPRGNDAQLPVGGRDLEPAAAKNVTVSTTKKLVKSQDKQQATNKDKRTEKLARRGENAQPRVGGSSREQYAAKNMTPSKARKLAKSRDKQQAENEKYAQYAMALNDLQQSQEDAGGGTQKTQRKRTQRGKGKAGDPKSFRDEEGVVVEMNQETEDEGDDA
ncbi:hypothetical protein BD410DRAFT_846782 [Rickenella mellea]|uniref:Uncharacterized protein n=1 Tax=Rickenella mellea TaxID=50990 RepID=A0A4Y7PF07_9AGAM|nr:hypothetical protein BD410DRAFT_846782 [Rickenella mellea]